MNDKNKIIVFLGSSLQIEEAKKILPQAHFFPPVKCGDIIHAIRLKPKIIAIIDGLFEYTAAVWHKEILLALEKGIIVYGASSMGALRAAELANFGMIGIGKIFQDFYSGNLNDDDEVAILHSDKKDGFKPLTDAMVNIRATLERAAEKNILDVDNANCIYKNAKDLFYRERTLAKAIKKAGKEAEVASFISWLKSGNHVDQKKIDAIELLEKLAKNDVKKTNNKTIVNRSVFLRALHKNAMCRPFENHNLENSVIEQVILVAVSFEKEYRQVRRLAYFWSVVNALTESPSDLINDNSQEIFSSELNHPNWEEENDCYGAEKDSFIDRIKKIENLINLAEKEYPNSIHEYIDGLKKLSNKYTTDKNVSKVILFTAHLWRIVEFYASKFNIVPSTDSVQNYANKFRHRHNLLTAKETEKWLQENDLDVNKFQSILASATCIDFLVLQNNVDALKITKQEENVWWLLDVMRLTGLYGKVKKAINRQRLRE